MKNENVLYQIKQNQQTDLFQKYEEEKIDFKNDIKYASKVDFNVDDSVFSSSLCKSRKDSKKYKAKLISESFTNVQQLKVGQTFTKSWTFTNNGNEPWPIDARLVFSNGVEMGEKEK